MGNLNLTDKEINKEVPNKLKLKDIRHGRERHGWYFLDEKPMFRVTMPNIHGKTLSPGFLRQCRRSTRLTTQQYANLVRCPMSGKEYEKIIRGKLERGEL